MSLQCDLQILQRQSLFLHALEFDHMTYFSQWTLANEIHRDVKGTCPLGLDLSRYLEH